MSYGILAWGKTGAQNRKRIESLHKKALKVLDLEYFTHKPLNYQFIYEYCSLTNLYKILYQNHHDYFKIKLQNILTSHNHDTRAVTDSNFNNPLYRK